MAVAAYKRASTESKDAGIKDYAGKRAPVLQQHLDEGRKLKGNDKWLHFGAYFGLAFLMATRLETPANHLIATHHELDTT